MGDVTEFCGFVLVKFDSIIEGTPRGVLSLAGISITFCSLTSAGIP